MEKVRVELAGVYACPRRGGFAVHCRDCPCLARAGREKVAESFEQHKQRTLTQLVRDFKRVEYQSLVWDTVVVMDCELMRRADVEG